MEAKEGAKQNLVGGWNHPFEKKSPEKLTWLNEKIPIDNRKIHLQMVGCPIVMLVFRGVVNFGIILFRDHLTMTPQTSCLVAFWALRALSMCPIWVSMIKIFSWKNYTQIFAPQTSGMCPQFFFSMFSDPSDFFSSPKKKKSQKKDPVEKSIR